MTEQQYKRASGAVFPVVMVILGYIVISMVMWAGTGSATFRTWIQLAAAVTGMIVSTIVFVTGKETKRCGVVMMSCYASCFLAASRMLSMFSPLKRISSVTTRADPKATRIKIINPSTRSDRPALSGLMNDMIRRISVTVIVTVFPPIISLIFKKAIEANKIGNAYVHVLTDVPTRLTTAYTIASILTMQCLCWII